MITISVVNRKGGVGKTTIAGHIAGGLAIKGYNVAMIDTDPQGSAARLLGLPKENGIWDMMVNRKPLTDVVRIVPPESYTTPDHPAAGAFWLVPSDTDTFMVPLKVQSALALRTRLREMARLLDLHVIIIDTAPTASMFDGSVYFASDGVIYVTECESFSLDGLQEGLVQLNEHQQERAELNMHPVPVIGIVPNKFRGGTKTHKEYIAELKTAYPDLVWSMIPQKTLWTDATKYGQLLYSYAPSSGEALAAWEIVHNVEGVVQQWAHVV